MLATDQAHTSRCDKHSVVLGTVPCIIAKGCTRAPLRHLYASCVHAGTRGVQRGCGQYLRGRLQQLRCGTTSGLLRQHAREDDRNNKRQHSPVCPHHDSTLHMYCRQERESGSRSRCLLVSVCLSVDQDQGACWSLCLDGLGRHALVPCNVDVS